MSFTHLRTFHAVAEHRGFTAAAAALNITQPTVTTQVRELEAHYGVELFLRLGRRIELTEVGRALLGITRRVMSLREEADELLSSHGRFQAGHLRLAAVGPFHATEIIASLKRRYPAMQILGAARQLGPDACQHHRPAGRRGRPGGMPSMTPASTPPTSGSTRSSPS